MKTQAKEDKQDMTLIQIMEQFATDEAARTHLEGIRWPKGIVCPHCKCSDQSKFSDIAANRQSKVRAGLRYCSACAKQFTVTIGTIFEDSHIPLRKWLMAWYLICSSKKGISSLQLQRLLELGSYRTALFMAHRIRYALQDSIFTEKLSGTVEVDETFVGGVKKGKGVKHAQMSKVPVVSLVQRGGNVRSQVMKTISAANLKQAVLDNVEKQSNLHTDRKPDYTKLGAYYDHRAVKHGAGEFSRHEPDMVVTTANVESYFSLLKRGVIGTFHHISEQHLPLYLAEFDYRYNGRKLSDGQRTIEGLQKAEGKRLMYQTSKS